MIPLNTVIYTNYSNEANSRTQANINPALFPFVLSTVPPDWLSLMFDDLPLLGSPHHS